VQTPTGRIPCFEDLRRLFEAVLGKSYTPEDYVRQFTTRVAANLSKLDRVERFCRDNLVDAPEQLFAVLGAQRERLLDASRRFGDMIAPECFIS
jgi:phosphoenolpyruvate carboxykinase (GTP)